VPVAYLGFCELKGPSAKGVKFEALWEAVECVVPLPENFFFQFLVNGLFFVHFLCSGKGHRPVLLLNMPLFGTRVMSEPVQIVPRFFASGN